MTTPAQPELSTEELHSVYRWIDSLPLSKPKKNIARDFSDAVLLSEVIHHYHPKLVDLHNYTPTLSLATKRTNWHTLSHKLLKKLSLPPLTDPAIQQLSTGQRGAIERLLLAVKQRMEGAGEQCAAGQSAGASGDRARRGRAEEKEWFGSGDGGQAEDELVMTSDGRVQQVPLGGGGGGGAPVGSGGAAERSREAIIADQRDTIDVLHDRVAKLEQLLQAKNAKIDALTRKVAELQQAGR